MIRSVLNPEFGVLVICFFPRRISVSAILIMNAKFSYIVRSAIIDLLAMTSYFRIIKHTTSNVILSRESNT